MEKVTVTIIGVDLAINVFQLHGAAADGSTVFRKKLSRQQFCKFMAAQPACIVAMEACGGAHYWAREMARIGHEPKLIAPRYVRPFVKRQKNDAADAEAIVEAAQRPTMRFVEPKTEQQSIETLKKRINALSEQGETSRRLRTMPGIGPVGALAIETFAPPMEAFKCGRDFAAWLGLVPQQNSTGGKQRLGRTSKMGQRDIRRLLIIGAMAVVRWASRKGTPEGSWRGD
jgi:transposase